MLITSQHHNASWPVSSSCALPSSEAQPNIKTFYYKIILNINKYLFFFNLPVFCLLLKCDIRKSPAKNTRFGYWVSIIL